MRNDTILYPGRRKRFAQAVDVYGKRIVVHKFVAFPKAQHDGLPAHHLPGPFQKHLQNSKLVFCERDALSPAHKA